MACRHFGRTGLRVSPLCLGCMAFAGRAEESDYFGIVDRALDAGLNFLDTADVYGHGKSEDVVGKALQRDGKRARVIVATKFYGSMDSADPNARGLSRRHVVRACEASLRRLRTDYIDLYQCHRPSSEVAIDETLRALDDLIRTGKVRYIGSSNFAAWQIVESLWAAKELGLNRFVSEQPPYHVLDRRIERELIPMAQTHGIAIIPWSPLAGGFLTGKYKRGQPRPEGARLQEGAPWADLHFTERAFDVIETIEAIAKEKCCTAGQFALAWCLSHPGITSPIIGPRTVAQLEEYLGALDIEITDADTRRVDAVAPPGRATIPYPYDKPDFGPGQYRW